MKIRFCFSPSLVLPLVITWAFLQSGLSATAATVTVNNLTTEVTALANPQPTLTSQTEWTVNINDRTGLVPGAPIRIVLTTSEHFLWLLTFRYDTGNLSLSSTPALSLLVAGQSKTVTQTLFQDYGFVPGDAATSDVAGFVVGPGLPSLEVTVPWAADLSQTKIRLGQTSSITGTNAKLSSSAVNLTTGLVSSNTSTFSVSLFSVIPEPTSALLLAMAGLGLCGWRRR